MSELAEVSVWELSGSTWQMVGRVAMYESLDVEIRHNEPGQWSLVMAWSSQANTMRRKRLITVDFRGERFTGRIQHISPYSDERGMPMLEVSGTGALSFLGGVLAWPDPAATLGTQPIRYLASGPAETVLRTVILANVVTRRGNALTIPATGGRGSSIELKERFTNLLEVVTKGARLGGIGIRMGLKNTTNATRAALTAEFYVPTDKSVRVRLSHKVGTLAEWRYSDDAPTGTRAIVAGSGAGTDRAIVSVVDAPAEAAWGWSEEIFVDARGAADGGTVQMAQDGRAALDDEASQSSFELSSTEALGMQYGTHFTIGDLVTVELLTGLSSVERLNAVQLRFDNSGRKVTLIPGNPNPKLGALIRAMNRRLRNLEQEES